jgi:hypothetical protein
VSQFEFLLTLYAIVAGLGLSLLVRSIGQMIEAREHGARQAAIARVTRVADMASSPAIGLTHGQPHARAMDARKSVSAHQPKGSCARLHEP